VFDCLSGHPLTTWYIRHWIKSANRSFIFRNSYLYNDILFNSKLVLIYLITLIKNAKIIIPLDKLTAWE
jgi:hypothetical protein